MVDYFAALEAFIRAVQLGTFTRAAAESGLKTSTVSRYITALEADLGVALFNRSTRRLMLTEAGRNFFEKSLLVMQDLEEARQSTSALNARPRGVLRINIPSAFGRKHVMPHMAAFLARFPEIVLDATLTDARIDLVETATDVAIRIGDLVDSTLIARRLATQRRLLVGSPEYCAQSGALATPDDLAHHRCLSFTLRQPAHWYYWEGAAPEAEMGQIKVVGPLRVNDSEALRDAVLSGQGIALLPSWLVADDLRAGHMLSLLDAWRWNIDPLPNPNIWAVYPPKKVVSPKVRVFIEFLAETFGSPPSWERAGAAGPRHEHPPPPRRHSPKRLPKA
jgi:DNA-binding transcriptional LysR family regulator